MKSNVMGFSWKAITSALLLTLCMAAGVQAQDPEPPEGAPQRLIPWQGYASFGVVGITRNQTARLNVAWISTGCPPHQWFDVDPNLQVPVLLLFLDARGNPIARHGGPIRPGQAVSLDLAGTSEALARRFGDSRRASVRAMVLLPGIPFPLLRPCLSASRTPLPSDPEPPPEPRDGTTVTPVIRPYLYPFPFPVSDSQFKLTVEVFNDFGETTAILENPTFLNGISPWPLAIAAPGGPTGVISDIPPPAP